tara:strand:- start:1406 stop:1816 length:411 start_codon:yes stop_codon:yes gene_type:complete
MRTVIKQTELSFMATAKTKLSALDKLKKAANLTPIKKEVTLSNGEDFEFWCTPLTMAERERAQKIIKDKEDMNAFALTLFVQKATDENGQRLFQIGQMAELKNEVRDSDLQLLMLAVIQDIADDAEVLNTKKLKSS